MKIFKDDKLELFTRFEKDYLEYIEKDTSEEGVLFPNYIEILDIGLRYSHFLLVEKENMAVYTLRKIEVYDIVDEKKWMLAKIKYGI